MRKPPIEDRARLLAWAYAEQMPEAHLARYRDYAAGGPLPVEERPGAERADRARRRHVPPAVRAEVLADEPVCRYCEVRSADTVDHVVPVAYGGTSDRSNLVSACWPCNSMKGALPATEEFRAAMREHGRLWLLAREWVDRLPTRSPVLEDLLAGWV